MAAAPEWIATAELTEETSQPPGLIREAFRKAGLPAVLTPYRGAVRSVRIASTAAQAGMGLTLELKQVLPDAVIDELSIRLREEGEHVG